MVLEKNELYSDIVLALYKNPPHHGKLEQYSLKASGGNPICGDECTMYVKIKGDTVLDISFENHGCAISTASEALLCENVKGKKIKEVLKLESGDIMQELGGIIPTRTKCALLGLVTLKRGLEEFENGKKEVKGIKI